jgi:hypothetical protein
MSNIIIKQRLIEFNFWNKTDVTMHLWEDCLKNTTTLSNCFSSDNIIPLQRLNKNDLNGQGLTEGDIVEQQYKSLGQHPKCTNKKIGVVVFDKSSFAIDWKVRDKSYSNLNECESKSRFMQSNREAFKHPTSSGWLDKNLDNLMLVGNIYSTPEMIQLNTSC